LSSLGCTSADVPLPSEPVPFQLVTPGRAVFVSSANGDVVEVRGVGAAPGLTVEGVPITPAADGSFTTTFVAHEGLNVVHAEDPTGRLANAFLFGRFASPDKMIPGAVTLRINSEGFKSNDPKVASLSRLAELAFDGIGLLAQLEGKTFTGTFKGGSWSFAVKKATYGDSMATLTPKAGGAAFIASLSKVEVNGVLSIDFSYTQTDAATIRIDSAIVSGDIEAGLADGALAVNGANITTTLNGFAYDSNNAGFPCCVDEILTDLMKSNLEAAMQEKVAEVLESKVALALNDLGLPPVIDLTDTGFPATLAVSHAFDAASFTKTGASLSAALRISGTPGERQRALGSPGWLELGAKPVELGTTTPHALSVSLDVLNQALFAVWGEDALTRTIDDVPSFGSVTLTPKLPPVVTLTPEGNIRAAIGEVFVRGNFGGSPVLATVSIIDDVMPSLDGEAGKLTLTPSGKPDVAITWIQAEGVPQTLRAVVEAMAVTQVPKLLSPFALPLPSLPLANFAPSLAGTVAAVSKEAKLWLDPKTNRARIEGALVLVPAN